MISFGLAWLLAATAIQIACYIDCQSYSSPVHVPSLHVAPTPDIKSRIWQSLRQIRIGRFLSLIGHQAAPQQLASIYDLALVVEERVYKIVHSGIATVWVFVAALRLHVKYLPRGQFSPWLSCNIGRGFKALTCVCGLEFYTTVQTLKICQPFVRSPSRNFSCDSLPVSISVVRCLKYRLQCMLTEFHMVQSRNPT